MQKSGESSFQLSTESSAAVGGMPGVGGNLSRESSCGASSRSGTGQRGVPQPKHVRVP